MLSQWRRVAELSRPVFGPEPAAIMGMEGGRKRSHGSEFAVGTQTGVSSALDEGV